MHLTTERASLFALLVVVSFWGSDVSKHKRWRNSDTITGDVVQYHHYLPATFIHHDSNVNNWKESVPENVRDRLWVMHHENGEAFVKMPLGVALCNTPGFAIAYVYQSFQEGESNSGYEESYAFMIVLSGLLFGLLGLWQVRNLLLRWFSERTTGIVILLLGLATNLSIYATWDAGMSHVYSFALVACFIRLTVDWYDTPHWKRSLLLGLVGGVMLLVRIPNAMFALIFLLWGISSVKEVKARVTFWLKHLGPLLLIGIVALLVFSIQLFWWKQNVGVWWLDSYPGENFYWSQPELWEGLFGARKGWLIYTPVMFLAFVGLFLKRGKLPAFKSALVLFLGLHLYIIFSWWCWWYGGSYGARPMIETYALLALPIALVVQRVLQKRTFRTFGLALICVFFVWSNRTRAEQYTRYILHYDSMTWSGFWHSWDQKHRQFSDCLYRLEPDYDRAYAGLPEYVELSAFDSVSFEIRDMEGALLRESTPSITNAHAHSGHYSFALDDSIRQSIALKLKHEDFYADSIRTRFNASAWAYTELPADSVRLYLVAKITEFGKTHEHWSTGQIDYEPGTWQKLELEVDLRHSKDPWAKWEFSVALAGKGKAWIDDLQVVVMEAPL